MSCCEIQRREGLECGFWKEWLRKGGLHVMLWYPEKGGFRVWTLEGVAQEGWVA
jgi:hypothetical protein